MSIEAYSISAAERLLRRKDGPEKVQVPTEYAPELPERFVSHVPANELQNDGAISSYRDDREEKSTHVIEYDDYWQLHLDEVNPRFDAAGHLVKDAPVETTLLLLFAIFYLYENGYLRS